MRTARASSSHFTGEQGKQICTPQGMRPRVTGAGVRVLGNWIKTFHLWRCRDFEEFMKTHRKDPNEGFTFMISKEFANPLTTEQDRSGA
jgi:hypothetical protein